MPLSTIFQLYRGGICFAITNWRWSPFRAKHINNSTYVC